MDLAILELDVVDFNDLQPVSEQPYDLGKRDFFGVPVSFIFEVAFVQLVYLKNRRICKLKRLAT